MKEEWGLPSTQPQPTSMTPAPNLKSNGNTAAYGLHPEEGPGKAKDGGDILNFSVYNVFRSFNTSFTIQI